jgi:hypothetical protein
MYLIFNIDCQQIGQGFQKTLRDHKQILREVSKDILRFEAEIARNMAANNEQQARK